MTYRQHRMTVAEARAIVMRNREEKNGTTCPCCDQNCKVYPRSLNAPMARLLIWLVNSYEGHPRWYNVHEFPLIQGRRGGGDFAKMVYWGLIEEREKDEGQDQRTSGFWRPTERGIDFVHRKISVRRKAMIYNKGKLRHEGERIDIVDALGEDFSYDELMGRT